ncbi:hypothetical protein BGZ46_008370 [Entomortierella lignicola]|nr:hypothetical protein BGZ46_008370 [Entomortierella lignicola]
MSSSAAPSIFNVPELYMMMTEYLTQKDITRLMRTCKYLYYTLEPLLWRHVTFTKRVPDEEIILRNRQHIRTLDFGNHVNYLYKVLGSNLFPLVQNTTTKPSLHPSIAVATAVVGTINLREFSIPERVLKPPNIIVQALAILSHSPCLVKVYLSGIIFKSKKLSKMTTDIIANGLPELRSISIGDSSFSTTASESTLVLMRACFQHQQLTKLHCELDISGLKIMEDLDLERQSKNLGEAMGLTETLPTGFNIKSIRLPNARYPSSFLMRIFNDYCPNLERLHLAEVKTNPGEDFDFTSQSWCANLQHVAYSHYSEPNETFLVAILKGSSNGVGIKNFHFKSLDRSKTAVLDSLLMFHSTTLKDMKIERSSSLSYGDIHKILKACGNMEKLWVEFQVLGDVEVPVEWDYLNLRQLALVFNPLQSPQGEAQNISFSMAKSTFKHIGRLSKLEALKFEWKDVKCLCLSSEIGGHFYRQEYRINLEDIGGLRNMKRICLDSNCWHNIGEAEVMFLHEQWPCLKKIFSARRNNNFHARQWKWLKKQRPYLNFDFRQTFEFN